MGLKIATLEDFELVSILGENFVLTTKLSHILGPDYVRMIVAQLLSSHLSEGIIFLFDDVGFLAARKTGLVAEEVAWYVTPDGRGQGIGKQLLDAFEYWAFMNQCKLIKMTSLDPETGKYFEKNGYVLGEYNYFKEIN